MQRRAIIAALAWLAFAAKADAGPLGLPLPALPAPITGTLGMIRNDATTTLGETADVARDSVGRPKRVSRALDTDANGFRIVRGEVMALSPSEASLAVARRLAFTVERQDAMGALGLSVTVLRAPDGMSASDAVAALRKADPQGAYDLNHIYDPSGGSALRVAPMAASPTSAAGESGRGLRIGMIDGGIDRRHDAFAAAHIVAQGFVPDGQPLATAHGTEVASLLVGRDDAVQGALPQATLYAADVYCGAPDGGSAEAIAQALSWFAANRVAVANISLAGPPNAILAAAVGAFLRRGHALVAAVGNDGPAAGVEYPAGYAGVAGVTAVDAGRTVELEANRGADVAFAARGVEVETAGLHGGHDSVTGTSFAAPIVAARFALLLPEPDAQAASAAWIALEKAALHLGPPGRNDIYGYGYLAPPGPSANATAAR